MSSRIRAAVIVVAGTLAPLLFVGASVAREGYWQGDVSTDWNTASNWFVVGAPGDGSFVPQSSGGFNVRAIIGTDNPNGALNTTTGNSPVISAALPTAKATIGGLYFGLRELDYTVNPPVLVNPAPAAGALVGRLTITGGTLNNVSTGEAAVGADGRIVVGADGRGFLTMTGGTLTGQALVVGGENYTGDALGTSMVDLNGTATLAINNATPANGTAALNRRLKITGPSAKLTTNGTVTFGSTSSLSAVITSAANPAGPAMIQSGSAVKLGGALNVEFSGAGAIGHSLGNKWNLLTATTGVSQSFNNLGVGNEITVSGLPSAPPTGSAYYIRTVNGGNGKLVQLSYEGVLVLNVNRDTGELKVTNPLGGGINIDAYTVRSALGSMKNSYSGIATDSGWVSPGLNPDTGEPLNDANRLTQWKQTGVYDVSGIGASGISLGSGFDRLAVAGDINNFGTDGEDVIFEYTSPNGGIVRGQIVYQGTKFENDLVLRVNPNTGQAFIKNDSLATLKFDGYSILSSTANLNGAGFTGLGGTWSSSPATSNALTQSNLQGSTTLAPGAQLAIGDISSLGFTTAEAKAGLSIQFLLTRGGLGGDYNNDGFVDAADYTVWRDKLGSLTSLPNDNTPGVTQYDYDLWKASFREGTTFHVGSVVFDLAAGAGGGALASSAVPEPGAAFLMGLGLVAVGLFRRQNRGCEVRNSLRISGGNIMSRRFQYSLVAASVFAVLLQLQPAAAATQGIALTNGDFALPGPLNSKTIAFDSTGAPLNNIPGWTFPGPGVEDYGHTDHANGDALGDSGTEGVGGGALNNEMILSTFDGVAYQTSSFNVVSIPATQKYQLSFDAKDIYTPLKSGAPTFPTNQTQLTARLYYLAANGTTRTTIGSPLLISGLGGSNNYTIEVAGGSAALTPALGRPIGVEFDTTSDLYNPTWVDHSWIGIDNVLLQIAGVKTGDLDGDGDVDPADYGIVRDHQQQAQLYRAEGELTGDGFVNLNDFRAFKTAYEAQNGAGSLAAALESAGVPEPSTLALVMLLTAITACMKCRQHLTTNAPLAFLALLGLAAVATPASAELLFYDPFLIGPTPSAGQYMVDTDGEGQPVPKALAGQNPVAPHGTQPDLLTGAWVAVNPRGMVLPAPGLNYIGAPAEGGSIGTVQTSVDPFTVDTRVGRYFKPGSEWTDTTVGTYYISWLENFGTITNVTDDMGFRSFEMWRTTAAIGDANLLGDLGYNAYYSPLGSIQTKPATAHMAFQQQIIEGSPVFFEDGATHLLVMKFVLSDQANSDTISVYLDPTSVTEPELPNLAITATNVQLAALGMGQFGGFGPSLNTIDELRIATTFIDALPELPLPGDTDGDRDVDLADYNNIITHMNAQVGTALEGDVAKADGTQGSDGRVTIADFRIWKDHFPTPASGAGGLGGGGVPEPASWVLLMMAAFFAAGRGHRRNR